MRKWGRGVEGKQGALLDSGDPSVLRETPQRKEQWITEMKVLKEAAEL